MPSADERANVVVAFDGERVRRSQALRRLLFRGHWEGVRCVLGLAWAGIGHYSLARDFLGGGQVFLHQDGRHESTSPISSKP